MAKPGPKKKKSGGSKKQAPIKIAKDKKGAFTVKAKAAGMSVAAYASKVLAKGSRASAATKKQANFARNARKWNK